MKATLEVPRRPDEPRGEERPRKSRWGLILAIATAGALLIGGFTVAVQNAPETGGSITAEQPESDVPPQTNPDLMQEAWADWWDANHAEWNEMSRSFYAVDLPGAAAAMNEITPLPDPEANAMFVASKRDINAALMAWQTGDIVWSTTLVEKANVHMRELARYVANQI